MIEQRSLIIHEEELSRTVEEYHTGSGVGPLTSYVLSGLIRREHCVFEFHWGFSPGSLTPSIELGGTGLVIRNWSM